LKLYYAILQEAERKYHEVYFQNEIGKITINCIEDEDGHSITIDDEEDSIVELDYGTIYTYDKITKTEGDFFEPLLKDLIPFVKKTARAYEQISQTERKKQFEQKYTGKVIKGVEWDKMGIPHFILDTNEKVDVEEAYRELKSEFDQGKLRELES
jgi:hypothetical protein